MPLIWIVGTSGVGKTTVGWALQRALHRSGHSAGFIDTDQLRNVGGIASGFDELIADGIAAVEPNFRAAGAKALILAAIVDDEAHLERLIPGRVRSQSMVIHLRASDAAVLDRVERRGWNTHLAGDSVAYARTFDSSWVDLEVDTTTRSAAEVVHGLEGAVAAFASAQQTPQGSGQARSAPVLATIEIITGPGGVGLSTSGFVAFLQRIGRGDAAGYIDSHQLGFVGADPRSPDTAAFRASNSHAIASVMAGHGVGRVLVTADPVTALALEVTADRVIWLGASEGVIASRLRARAAGGGPPLAGDHRLGLDADQIRLATERSLSESRDHSVHLGRGLSIDTDSLTPEEVAQRINAG